MWIGKKEKEFLDIVHHVSILMSITSQLQSEGASNNGSSMRCFFH
jgi:hypothetical protein